MTIELIIGLGNPSREYQNTYHNFGYLAADFFNKNLKTRDPEKRRGSLGDSPLYKLKTDVPMNQSGLFVKKALQKYQVKSENMLIIHDDSDIELGKYKLSFGRGSAGHKGAQSIIGQLKTKNFWRLRLGIRPKRNKMKAGDLVLKKITPAHRKIIASVLKSFEKRPGLH